METGILKYIKASVTVDVYFPVSKTGPDVRCEMCRFYRMSSRRCALNDAVVQYPTKYIGGDCPLIFEEEE